MQFELTKKYLGSIKESIKTADEIKLNSLVSELHPADIAEILDEVSMREAKFLYQLLDEEKAADVLVELEEDVREEFLANLSSKEIAEQFIENLDSDDAADVIAELPDKKQEEVIAYLEDEEQASDIVELLTYDESTAGSLMTKELIKVNQNWIVERCVLEMRKQAEEVDYVFTIYVVDSNDKLLGIVSLKRMLITPVKTTIADFYKSDVIFVNTNTDLEEVSNIMQKYDLVVLPVVNEEGQLIGRITIDDVMDVVKEEADKDYQMASGHSEVVEATDTVWVLSRARLPWLLIGLVGGIFGAQIISIYEDQIKIHPEMAFFIPLIAAMGGNVGVQSSSIIVQGLANKTLGLDTMLQRLGKEFSVALVNGLVCSLIILGYNFAFGDSWNLSITVSAALFTVIIFAGLFGTFTPLVLDKYKIDPALATGPFITTVNDVLGLLMYFMIGRMMYM